MSATLVVYVKGGVVQSVMSDDPDVVVIVHDADDIAEGGDEPYVPIRNEWHEVA